MPKLSIFSVVKNEEAMIEGSLKSMEGADEIIIVDTGSTDKTLDIAKKYTDKIYHFEWIDDFSAVKNFAMSKCSGDWIVGLDADCRLEKDGVKKIKEMVKSDHDVYYIKVVPTKIENRETNYHLMPKVFKAGKDIHYSGRVHEFVKQGDKVAAGYGTGEVAIVYLYSPNHFTDPDRNLRILLQEVKDHPQVSRWKFYLGREYYQKKDFIKAIWWLNEFLKIGKWAPEISNAYLVLARCYWQLQKGDDARMLCSHAIRINPDFKEALLFMAETHYEPFKSKWKQFADLAKNTNVLFKK